MLVIRLSRKGRKKRPTYRIVLQERDWAPSSKAIENLGHMDPHTDPATVVLQADRIKYWLSQGAQASSTVHNILVKEGVIEAEVKRVVFGKPTVDPEAEAKAAAEAEAKAEAAKVAAEETPAEEVKEEIVEEPKAEDTTTEEVKEA